MKVRTKAFLQVVGGLIAGSAVVVLLDYLSPKYGLTIWMAGIAVYLMWCVYNIRVNQLESKQNEIVDILKK